MAEKIDYLKFSAYSMKDLITRRLSESSAFTDQVYEGSNLAILIDLVSYMYQCLIYCTNNAASESMFEDTQVYENITRLVNLLGYQPKGCFPASFNVYVAALSAGSNVAVYPYTYLDTGLTDGNGKKICFSTRRSNIDQENENTVNLEQDIDGLQETLYNGQWKAYSTIFTASGTDNETFTLDGLGSDFEDKRYVAGDFIDVMVCDSGLSTGSFWNVDVDGLFTNSDNISKYTTTNTTIYGADDEVYSIKLNQDKTYELRFGDGIVGKKLQSGQRVVVFYLDTNGPDGKIDLDGFDFSQIKLHTPTAASLGVSTKVYGCLSAALQMAEDSVSIADVDHTVQTKTNYVQPFKQEESVDEIRKNAPNWFKLGNRLITRKDYEYFVKNNSYVRSEIFCGYSIADVKCMNNIEYVATFYKWLYMWGKNGPNRGSLGFSDGAKHYFQQSFWQRTEYASIDPADANNTYLWVKVGNPDYSDQQDTYSVDTVNRGINQLLQPFKTLTTEIQVVKPVIVDFDICACDDFEYIRDQYMTDDSTQFDGGCESYIEVTLDNNTLYIGTAIAQQVYNIIVGAFDVNTCRLGQGIDCSDIAAQIQAIQGVTRVRTVFEPSAESGMQTRIYDGISFASWSPVLNDASSSTSKQNYVGIDLEVGNSARKLEDFQFPRFVGMSKLKDRVKVIKKSLTTINTIKM